MIGSSGSLRVLAFVAASSCCACYGAVGPTIGVATPTGRTTAGFEFSAATLTIAQSFALDRGVANSTARERWRQRTYIVWEPSYAKLLVDNTNEAFPWLGGGLTLGAHIDELDSGRTRAGFAGGVFMTGGTALVSDTSEGCGDDKRPYVVLVIGFRGEEFYAAPKVGLMEVPELCINFGL